MNKLINPNNQDKETKYYKTPNPLQRIKLCSLAVLLGTGLLGTGLLGTGLLGTHLWGASSLPGLKFTKEPLKEETRVAPFHEWVQTAAETTTDAGGAEVVEGRLESEVRAPVVHPSRGADNGQPVVGDDFGINLQKIEIAPVRNPAENKNYLGPRVPIKGRSILPGRYERSHSSADKKRAGALIQQASNYLEAGKERAFLEMLSDVIRQYHFTKEAALAGFHLADYYEKKSQAQSNLKSMSYYAYVINLHTYSGYEEEALFKLSQLLNKEKCYVKSEEILLYLINVIDRRTEKDPTYTSIWREKAEKYLTLHYNSFIRWGRQQGNDEVIAQYKNKTADLVLLKKEDSLSHQENPAEDLDKTRRAN